MRGIRDSQRAPRAPQSQRERLAIEYAELVTRGSNCIPGAFFERLRAAFNDPEIVELTFVIGILTMLNRFNNALEVRYRGEFKNELCTDKLRSVDKRSGPCEGL